MSCFDRVKMGFMIGFAVGMSAAGLFGTYAALRYWTHNHVTCMIITWVTFEGLDLLFIIYLLCKLDLANRFPRAMPDF